MVETMHPQLDFAVLNHDEDLYYFCLYWAEKKLDWLDSERMEGDTRDAHVVLRTVDARREWLALAGVVPY